MLPGLFTRKITKKEIKKFFSALTITINTNELSLQKIDALYQNAIYAYLFKISPDVSNIKIYKLLLDCEHEFNKKLIHLGIMTSNDESLTYAYDQINLLVSEEAVNAILNRASELIIKLTHDIETYQQGIHLALVPPHPDKIELLQTMRKNLCNAHQSIGNKTTTYMHIDRLLDIVVKTKMSHHDLVSSTSNNLSPGEASKILTALSNDFTKLLLSVNASNERQLLYKVNAIKDGVVEKKCSLTN
jgi:hypothetical protein